MPEPPMASHHPHSLTAHGHTRIDDWYWLGDRENPETLEYLEAENAYTDAILAPTAGLQETLFQEIKSRVQETDAGPPTRHDDWWYFTRTVEGSQYPIVCRRPDPQRALDAASVAADARAHPAGSPDEQIVLDENVLAGDGDYFAVGVLDVSPDHSTVAYAVDRDGSELYSLRFRDIATSTDLPDAVDGVYYGSAWATDSRTFFYVRPDEAMRPYQVWRHRLGQSDDEVVFQEDDERFFVEVDLSRSQKRIVIHSSSKTSGEAVWLDAARPDGVPRFLLPRQADVEYDAEHDGEAWLIRTNRPNPDGSPAPNFALYRLAEEGGADLEPVLAHRADVKLESVEAFADYLVVDERWEADALERLRVIPRAGEAEAHVIDQPEPVYSLVSDSNPEWDSPTYRFGYTSLVTPHSSIEYDVATGTRTRVWTQLVPGGYDANRYRTERLWADAPDGARIPISLVTRSHYQPGAGDPPPCLLYGYGAYGMTIDPTFSAARLSLLERGVSFAIAHIRGGGERGRAWYDEGKMEHKTNSFRDFIAAAEALVDAGWADRRGLVARGGSAGGLLMGAVANLRPDLWRAMVAEVPFVDVVTTMSDTTLPLTVTEWEEWGDPVHDQAAYERMLSYSPYDNVADDASDYPSLYVSAGLNDPRVGYWEPAKWVAKLRAAGAGGPARPVVLRTELGAGHGGPSGRYDVWRDEARVLAFALRQVGQA